MSALAGLQVERTGSPPQLNPFASTYCSRHPAVETDLRCHRCEQPICLRCAQRSPIGFRCPDCLAEIRTRFHQGITLNPLDQPLRKPVVNFLLLGAVALVWLLMELAGGSTNEEVLIRFGADHGPSILRGEFWRFFSAMFLHIGPVHLALNAIALVFFGFDMERAYGRVRFAVIYLLSGLFGSLASFAYRGPLQLSAGASGAIFGVIGMNLAFFLIYREGLGEFGRANFRQTLAVIALNLSLGFTVISVDNAAHLGGLAAGLALGYGLAPRYQIDPSGASNRPVDLGALTGRWWVPALGVLGLVVGTWLATSHWMPG